MLAGGQGIRLRSLTRVVCGDERPKQYVPLIDDKSLLRSTLDRVASLISLERTVVVAQQQHLRYVTNEFVGRPAPRVLFQPADRGTAAGILWPAHWISWRDPEALVAVFPSDHFVLGEPAFMDHVLDVATFVNGSPKAPR